MLDQLEPVPISATDGAILSPVSRVNVTDDIG